MSNENNSTSKTVKQWYKTHCEEDGPYAVLAGFEEALRGFDDELDDAYQEMDLNIKVELFSFVIELLEKEGGQ